jgi:perosamine synthetase
MIPVSEPLLAGSELDYLRDCIATGWISSSGKYVERFEQDWADYCGVKHGIAVSNGTAALQIAVDALRLEPGDEIVMPSFTIISCLLAVIRAGAKPVLVDSDRETYCMDVEQAAAAITPRTRAIMPVHIYGHPVDMDPLLDLAEKHGLAIIEDAAQAHGSQYFSHRGAHEAWRRCGSLSTISAFSFYANKPVTTGEGGMVLTDSDVLAERCRSLRDLCFQPRRFFHEELGYNYRLTNMQAAIGVAQVEGISGILERKRRIGALYAALLADVEGIKLQGQRDWARVNYSMISVVLQDEVRMDAFEFAALLGSMGVDSRPFFMGMHEQPVLRARGLFEGVHLPVTERLYRRGLYVPSGLALTEAQIETVASTVKDAVASTIRNSGIRGADLKNGSGYQVTPPGGRRASSKRDIRESTS